jgi:putative ABC transport system ATP-binding protein
MIKIENLGKSYGPRTLWSGLDFTVQRGQLLALVGPSGSGKSTLLNCLGLLDSPSTGAIHHEGKDITGFGPGAARRYRRDVLGYLFQNYALIENATVAANLEVAMKPRRKRGGSPTVADALKRVRRSRSIGSAAANSSALRSLASSSRNRPSCWPTNLPAPSITRTPPWWWIFSAR